MKYCLKISLHWIKPPVWRRVWVNPTRSLEDLHFLIQFTFGWTNSHLYQFEVKNKIYEMPGADPDFAEGESIEGMTIGDVLTAEGDWLNYEYDFGDMWRHRVELEKIADPEIPHEPFLQNGKRSGPPEDCGGAPGYEGFLKILKSPKHPEHKLMKEWAGGGFDPEFLDIDDVNEQLSAFEEEVASWKDFEDDLLDIS